MESVRSVMLFLDTLVASQKAQKSALGVNFCQFLGCHLNVNIPDQPRGDIHRQG